ncbi:MAG: glycerol-3-phosphate dehydrogenase [Sphingomonadaceae bacterium]|nr:glycerol-3-phosphate dehydrogenase [Sphingomonadaceae bacterium]
MTYDLLIIGGGINGTAIARDAAGRGWKTLLVERDDLASHTSSASSKLIHGGIRYLEYYEFRLVREALKEREVMLRSAPHLIKPMRFVLPHEEMARPFWMIRAGLLLYDFLGGKRTLSGTRKLGKANPQYRSPLANPDVKGFAYSDCWVDDARLVVANAIDARDKGAEIATYTELLSAERSGAAWTARLSDGRSVEARTIVNAAGPWVSEVLGDKLGVASDAKVRLVRGSHIIVPRLYAGDHAYILQQPDKRVVFAMPYLDRFTLIGTTDVAVDDPGDAVMTTDEVDYLCKSVNHYFAVQTTPDDVVSLYSGVRSLYDDGAEESSEVTREYVLEMDGGDESGAPTLLSVFGGKITTARALAEDAADRIAEAAALDGSAWTREALLPGGEIGGDFDAFFEAVEADYPFLDWADAKRMARVYGSRIKDVIGDARSLGELGEHFGGGLTQREVDYLIAEEWAKTADDILWRRSKMGLAMDEDEQARLETWLGERVY